MFRVPESLSESGFRIICLSSAVMFLGYPFVSACVCPFVEHL